MTRDALALGIVYLHNVFKLHAESQNLALTRVALPLVVHPHFRLLIVYASGVHPELLLRLWCVERIHGRS